MLSIEKPAGNGVPRRFWRFWNVQFRQLPGTDFGAERGISARNGPVCWPAARGSASTGLRALQAIEAVGGLSSSIESFRAGDTVGGLLGMVSLGLAAIRGVSGCTLGAVGRGLSMGMTLVNYARGANAALESL